MHALGCFPRHPHIAPRVQPRYGDEEGGAQRHDIVHKASHIATVEADGSALCEEEQLRELLRHVGKREEGEVAVAGADGHATAASRSGAGHQGCMCQDGALGQPRRARPAALVAESSDMHALAIEPHVPSHARVAQQRDVGGIWWCSGARVVVATLQHLLKRAHSEASGSGRSSLLLAHSTEADDVDQRSGGGCLLASNRHDLGQLHGAGCDSRHACLRDDVDHRIRTESVVERDAGDAL